MLYGESQLFLKLVDPLLDSPRPNQERGGFPMYSLDRSV